MRVKIERSREERRVRTGWFATETLPAYAIDLVLQFSEEKRFLITHTGIGARLFFQSPLPLDVTDPKEIARLKAERHGEIFVRDLLSTPPALCIGLWPDVIAADEVEATLRARLTELAEHITKASGRTEYTAEFEP